MGSFPRGVLFLFRYDVFPVSRLPNGTLFNLLDEFDDDPQTSNEKKLEAAQTSMVKTAVRPRCRPTFWKLWTDKVDAIQYFTVRRGELTRSITWAQNTGLQRVAGCGFVVFSDMQTSAVCGQINFETDRHKCKTSPAPVGAIRF